MQIPTRELYINGSWAPPSAGKRLDIVTPIDGSTVGSIPAASKPDVERAIAAANAAHKSGVWGKLPGSKRGAVMRSIAQEFRRRKTELAQYETVDCGKPIVEAEADLDEVIGSFEFYAGLAEKLEREGDLDLKVPDETLKIVVRKEPLGVCALITPWNYPLLMAVWKVAAALAAGNTIVLKPSEMASVTCLEMAELCFHAGLPAGVLNVVTGTGAGAGAPLSESKEVHKVSFTGSVATGRRIGLCAMQNLKPTTLELGGKSPVIVFADSVESEEDLEKTVEWIMFGIFWTVGEICSATSRLIIQEEVADRFYARLKQRTEEIVVGNPLEPDTRLGPLVNESQYNKVLGFIQNAKEDGCKLLTGGGRQPGFEKGYYMAPTIFTGVKRDSQLWNEEVFGPVLACATFKTEAEALDLANDSEFGLAAAVFSKDAARCERVVSALECGIVWVKNTQLSHISAPWGGVKNSGFGRDCGEASLEHYMNTKQITTWVSPDPLGWYPSKL